MEERTKLPKGWTIEQLSKIIDKPQYGYTTKSSLKGTIKFLRTTDLSKGKVDWGNVPFCDENPKDFLKFKLQENDIVISRAGSVGLSYKITECPENAVFASYLIRIRANNADTDFIYYFLKSSNYWNQISSLSSGIAVQNINATKLKNLLITLPPLPEQKRIVAKLDQLFGRLEKVKAGLERIPDLIKLFRQSVLTQAVTGRLTEEWRKGKDLGEWEEKRIEDLTTKVGSGATPKGGSASYKSSGIPLIRSMNVHFGGIKYEGLAYLDEKQAKKLKNVIVKEGDVLLNITGASIGRVCILKKDLAGARVNQHVSIVRPNSKLVSKYLEFYLASSKIQNLIMSENYGVTRQALTKGQLLNLKVRFPSLQEQKEIVRQVESLFSKADKIEQEYERLTDQVEVLPQAILAKAFRGELM